MTTKRFFGTDGIRGRVGEGVITPDFILKLGWAVGSVLKRQDPTAVHTVIIGKDTRISGYLFESALEAGLIAAGVHVRLLGPMPTPAIAYLTRAFRADIGIVISASHNPFYDNGIKFFGRSGTKIDDAMEQAIEAMLDEPLQMVDSAFLGKAARIEDAPGRYIEFCKSTFPNHLSLSHLTIVLDCANGATYHVAPHVFEELGARLNIINNYPDGFNINDRCGSTHPELLARIVIAEGADLGIALDGDGDRLIMVDHLGQIVDGDALLYIIAKNAQGQGQLGGGVVGTTMTNLGVEQAFKEAGIAFDRAAVGDRHVMELLKTHGWRIGGEASGHLICLDATTTGDGIIAALKVLAVIVETKESLHALQKSLVKLPQTLLNIKVSEPKAALQDTAFQQAIVQAEATLGQRGRLLVRASGTEPLIRIMIESPDARLNEQLATRLAQFIIEQ